jgi:hypothetical protein
MQMGAPRMPRAVHQAERVAEPLPLRLGEHRQRRSGNSRSRTAAAARAPRSAQRAGLGHSR